MGLRERHIKRDPARYRLKLIERYLRPRLTLALVLMGSLFASPLSAQPAAGRMTGTYESGDLAGNGRAVLMFEKVGRGIVGQLTDENGKVFALRGKGSDTLVQGKIFHLDRSVGFVAEKVGASVFLSYTSFEERGSRSGVHRSLLLRKRGPSQEVKQASHGAAKKFSEFLSTYQRWSDARVAQSFKGLAPGHRALVQLFGYLHADLFIRVCRADRSGAAQSELGWSQSLSCNDLLSRANFSLNREHSQEIALRAKQQAQSLAEMIVCLNRTDAGYVRPRCERAGISFSPVASSWRDAAHFLPPRGATSEKIKKAVLKPKPGEAELSPHKNASTLISKRTRLAVPILKPYALAARRPIEGSRTSLMPFRRLEVNWGSEAKAVLHEWSLAYADDPDSLDDGSVGAVAPSTSAPR